MYPGSAITWAGFMRVTFRRTGFHRALNYDAPFNYQIAVDHNLRRPKAYSRVPGMQTSIKTRLTIPRDIIEMSVHLLPSNVGLAAKGLRKIEHKPVLSSSRGSKENSISRLLPASYLPSSLTSTRDVRFLYSPKNVDTLL